jgi:uncharacterized protein affecting Mg2+/Co2+ transport
MKTTLIALLTVGILAVVTGFSINKSRVRNMDIQVNVKALPEHGLQIISPSDPLFDKELSALLKGNQVELKQAVEAIRPFCVFVKNTGAQDVVMYSLKWELTKANGMVLPLSVATGSPGVLMGVEQPKNKTEANGGDKIRPNATRFLTADLTLKNYIYAMRADAGETFKKSFQDYMIRVTPKNNKLLEGVTNITVSLDGAFFEDGSFVGPDTTNLFPRMQGQIDAQRDVATAIEQGLKQRKTYDEIFNQIESLANQPDSGQASLQDKSYKSSFKMLVDDLVRMRATRGDKAVVEESQQPLQRPWPKLHKKSNPNEN